MELKGREFSYVRIRFVLNLRYIPNTACPTFEIFKQEVTQMTLSLIVVNENLDADNFEDPVSTTVNDNYFVTFDTSAYTYYDVLIQKNEYELDKGYIQNDISKGNLYQVIGASHNVVRQTGDSGVFLSATLRLSSGSKVYTSRTYKIVDLLGTIGGVYEMAFGILSLIFSFISRKLYFYYMINSIQKVRIQPKNRLDRATENDNSHNNQRMNRPQPYSRK